MKSTVLFLGPLAGALLAALPLAAQSLPGSAPTRPSLALAASGAYIGEASGKLNGTDAGDLRVSQWRMNVVAKYQLQEALSLELGVMAGRIDIDVESGSLPLPDVLESYALSLGGTWRIDPQWSVSLTARPGVYGDSEASGSDSFSVPVVAMARYQFRDNLALFGGFAVQPLADSPLMPVLGVTWQINEELKLSLGVPRTELAYALNPGTTLFIAAGGDFGAYAIDDPKIVAPAGRNLRDTKLEYKAFRATVGVEQSLGACFALRLEGGVVFEREFDYYERGVTVEPDNAGIISLSLSADF